MPAKDGFRPDDRFPLIRPEHTDEAKQPGIGKSWGRAVVSSQILKISVLAVTAIGVAILLLRNSVEIFANVTDSPVDISALQPGTGQPTPSAGAEALPPTARNGTTRGEIAGAFEPADQGQTEIRQPSARSLVEPIPGLGGRRRYTGTGRAGTARTRCSSTGCTRCPSAGSARARASTGSARAKRAGRDPAGPRCTGTGPARKRHPTTVPVRAKCPGTLVPARLRSAQLNLAGSDAVQVPRGERCTQREDFAQRTRLWKAQGHAWISRVLGATPSPEASLLPSTYKPLSARAGVLSCQI